MFFKIKQPHLSTSYSPPFRFTGEQSKGKVEKSKKCTLNQHTAASEEFEKQLSLFMQ